MSPNWQKIRSAPEMGVEYPDSDYRSVVPLCAVKPILDEYIQGAVKEVATMGKKLVPYEVVEAGLHWLDRGGPCAADRKLYKFHLDDLPISIPATDVGSYLRSLRTMKPMPWFSTPVFVLGVMCCDLALTLNQKNALQEYLSSIEEEAKIIAQAEGEAWNERFSQSSHPNVQVSPKEGFAPGVQKAEA